MSTYQRLPQLDSGKHLSLTAEEISSNTVSKLVHSSVVKPGFIERERVDRSYNIDAGEIN